MLPDPCEVKIEKRKTKSYQQMVLEWLHGQLKNLLKVLEPMQYALCINNASTSTRSINHDGV